MRDAGRVRRVGGAVLALLFAAGLVATVEGCKPKPKKAFGETCAEDLDCESMTCSDQGNICSKSCTYDRDCGGEYVCHATAPASGVCSKNLGAPPNGGCQQGDDCANGNCLHKVGEDTAPGICSKWCATADDCPAGMKLCERISDSGALKYCLPGGADPAARPKFGPPKTGTKGGSKAAATSKVPPPPPQPTTKPATGAPPGAPTAAPSAKPTAPPAPTGAKPPGKK